MIFCVLRVIQEVNHKFIIKEPVLMQMYYNGPKIFHQKLLDETNPLFGIFSGVRISYYNEYNKINFVKVKPLFGFTSPIRNIFVVYIYPAMVNTQHWIAKALASLLIKTHSERSPPQNRMTLNSKEKSSPGTWTSGYFPLFRPADRALIALVETTAVKNLLMTSDVAYGNTKHATKKPRHHKQQWKKKHIFQSLHFPFTARLVAYGKGYLRSLGINDFMRTQLCKFLSVVTRPTVR